MVRQPFHECFVHCGEEVIVAPHDLMVRRESRADSGIADRPLVEQRNPLDQIDVYIYLVPRGHGREFATALHLCHCQDNLRSMDRAASQDSSPEGFEDGVLHVSFSESPFDDRILLGVIVRGSLAQTPWGRIQTALYQGYPGDDLTQVENECEPLLSSFREGLDDCDDKTWKRAKSNDRSACRQLEQLWWSRMQRRTNISNYLPMIRSNRGPRGYTPSLHLLFRDPDNEPATVEISAIVPKVSITMIDDEDFSKGAKKVSIQASGLIQRNGTKEMVTSDFLHHLLTGPTCSTRTVTDHVRHLCDPHRHSTIAQVEHGLGLGFRADMDYFARFLAPRNFEGEDPLYESMRPATEPSFQMECGTECPGNPNLMVTLSYEDDLQ